MVFFNSSLYLAGLFLLDMCAFPFCFFLSLILTHLSTFLVYIQTTKEELVKYMNSQLDILTENNAQCQAAVTEFQNEMRKASMNFTDSMKTAVSDTEKRVGRISEFYSNDLSMLKDTAEKYLSRIFWITVIPSAITAVYYLTLLILRLI